MGAHAPVVARDDHAAATRRRCLIHAVFHPQTCGVTRLSQLLRVFIFTDAADVEDGSGGEDILRATSGVLGGAAGNELGVAIGEELGVEAHVLFFGEYGIIGFEFVLLEESLIAADT